MSRARLRGFSLIEIVVALGIVAAMLMLFQAVLVAERAASTAREQGSALSIVENELESVRAAGFDALPGSGAFSDPGLATLPGGAGTITVTPENSSLSLVAVTVSWQGRGGESRSVSLSTVVGKTGALP